MIGDSAATAAIPGNDSTEETQYGQGKHDFRILGPVEVGPDGSAAVGGPKQRTFLTALLLHANRPVSLEWLTEALWEGEPPASAVANLRTYARSLRAAVAGLAGVRVAAQHRSYRLTLPPQRLDLTTFDQLAAGGRQALTRAEYDPALVMLDRALRLWRGPLTVLNHCGKPLAARLELLWERRLAAIEDRAETLLHIDRPAEAVVEMRLLLGEYRFRERAWALLMRALRQTGDNAGALDAYQQARSTFADDLGIEPGTELTDLQQSILHRHPVTAAPGRSGPAPATTPTPGRLSARPPRQLPRPPLFVGRADLLRRLARRLHRRTGLSALIIVGGPPGTGKSTLAVQLAHTVADQFPDGHLYASLSQTGTPALRGVLARFLRALDEPDADHADLDELAARFRSATAGRRLLVVIDNAADEERLQPLLPAEAGCAVLVATRRMPKLDHATRIALGPLTPAESVRLLVELVGPDRVAADPPAATELARRCEHLPLALHAAGAVLAGHPDWSLRSTVDRLARGSVRLRYADPDPGQRLRAVQDRLATTDPAAARLLGLLVGRALIGITVPIAAAALGLPAAEAAAALDRLDEEHLVRRAGPHRYRPVGLVRLAQTQPGTGPGVSGRK